MQVKESDIQPGSFLALRRRRDKCRTSYQWGNHGQGYDIICVTRHLCTRVRIGDKSNATWFFGGKQVIKLDDSSHAKCTVRVSLGFMSLFLVVSTSTVLL